ncbi:MAG: tyrosine-type recombinase/integrase [Treponema sp.]|nr:tyrosine-type recombinase/integrase [Treponema sp.]
MMNSDFANLARTEKIRDYLVYLRSVRGVSDRTLQAYGSDLRRFEDYCENISLDPVKAGAAEVRGFIGDLSFDGIASVSVNRALSSLRGFYHWLMVSELRKDDPTELLRNLRTARNLPVFLWEEEMAGFADLPDTAHILWPPRDKAIIMVMYSAGLRISEVVSLEADAIEKDLRGARVVGKGNKERRIFFSEECRTVLAEWLPYRNSTIPAEHPTNKLFISRKGRALSVSGLRWIIAQYAGQSVLPKKVHPHAFRHSFATHLVNSGCDVRVVQELLGHASLSTTQRYTHVDIEGLKRVYSESHPHGDRHIVGKEQ